LMAFVQGIAHFGCLNSLSLVAFKLTSPGVPDIYQGCETWNFNLVDPDNRRRVDFKQLRTQLSSLQALFAGGSLSEEALATLCRDWLSGRLTMLVTWRLLRLRHHHPLLFS